MTTVLEKLGMQPLHWYEVSIQYGSALVAATDHYEARKLAGEVSEHFNNNAALTEQVSLPGPPTEPGVYHWYAE